jgi:hypothetical protein
VRIAKAIRAMEQAKRSLNTAACGLLVLSWTPGRRHAVRRPHQGCFCCLRSACHALRDWSRPGPGSLGDPSMQDLGRHVRDDAALAPATQLCLDTFGCSICSLLRAGGGNDASSAGYSTATAFLPWDRHRKSVQRLADTLLWEPNCHGRRFFGGANLTSTVLRPLQSMCGNGSRSIFFYKLIEL